ncbi:hypothetical protein [Deinococcus murrayi]|uniref:hypothetical protein n=1 Tax=Deinococcus murrayi TaxID=68910 RepID=UPI0005550A8B|nr:hypothetical protein [Deinococcus murrayi]
MPQPRLPLPPEPAVYHGLCTDHYPWTEVTSDLLTRQGQGLSAVFDAQQGPHWARFVWVGGALRGGFTAHGEVGWAQAMAGLPRARVSLTPLPPAVAETLWTARSGTPQPLEEGWPAGQARLEGGRFSGVLLAPGACSYWQRGRLLAGTLPEPGAACEWLGEVAPPPSDAELLAFWQELLAATHRHTSLDEVWRTVCVRLAAEHPCLDPFAREVTLQGGRLTVDPSVPAQELLPALLAAFRASLTRLGQPLAELPLGNLPDQPEWQAAGLGAA